jgi:hypothetical protein
MTKSLEQNLSFVLSFLFFVLDSYYWPISSSRPDEEKRNPTPNPTVSPRTIRRSPFTSSLLLSSHLFSSFLIFSHLFSSFLITLFFARTHTQHVFSSFLITVFFTRARTHTQPPQTGGDSDSEPSDDKKVPIHLFSYSLLFSYFLVFSHHSFLFFVIDSYYTGQTRTSEENRRQRTRRRWQGDFPRVVVGTGQAQP